MSTINRRQSIVLCAAAVLGAPALASSPRFPSQPIKVVVPYPAGGNADNIARVFSKRFGEELKTPVVVDNKGGASGTIGADSVYKANPDGYTLLLTVTSQLTSVPAGVKPTYNAIKDFTPVVGLCVTPLAFAVGEGTGVKSMKELEAWVKGRKVAYGSYGKGTSTHVMQHQLMKQLGAKDAAHVPYRGESPMVADMLGGQVDMGFVGIGQARELQKNGRVRILAVVATQRSEFLPDVPTFTELGYKDLDWSYGVAVYAASKTPEPILKALQDAAKKVMQDPEVQKAYRAQSNQPWLNVSLDEMKKRLVLDTDNWAKALAEVGTIE